MASLRRKIEDREDALELLQAWEDSGEPLGSFCADYGVDGRSLHCWKLNLARATRDAAPIRLVEFMPPPAVAATYRIVVGKVTIEVDDDFDEGTLARLLAMVGC